MIPRLHKRGNSFKGALGYVLHDPGKSSSERVGWVVTQNIYAAAEDAWFEMFETYRNRTTLKANAGVDPRGRDNKNPVLHFTLAWALSETPERDHMEAMARDALKALGLAEHEAVIACHTDKEHHHVHVVVNTVHPYTGKTAPMKFSKLEFSKWAEAYEREHGIHCEERIKNNEKRREIAKQREAERAEAALAILTGKQPQEPAPFEPVNDNSPHRRRWFERREIIDKMKALRAALDREHRTRRGGTWQRQLQERDIVDRGTRKALDAVGKVAREAFKHEWVALYKAHKREMRELATLATHPFERAVFVFRNRNRLGYGGKSLTLKQMVPLILSGRRLKRRVLEIRDYERRKIAGRENAYARLGMEHVWKTHHAAFDGLVKRQAAERASDKALYVERQNEVTFENAKSILLRDADRGTAKHREDRDASMPRLETKEREAERPIERAPEGVPIAPQRLSRPQQEIIWAADRHHRRPDLKSVLMPESNRHPDARMIQQFIETGVMPPRHEGVPAAPERQADRARATVQLLPRQRQDAKSVLMPRLQDETQPARGAPRAAKKISMTGDASLLLKGRTPAAGIAPVVPKKQQEVLRPEPKQAVKPFRDAATTGAPDLDAAFRKAVTPPAAKPAVQRETDAESVKRDFDRARTRPWGDFERER